jgi:hypothetical protein
MALRSEQTTSRAALAAAAGDGAELTRVRGEVEQEAAGARLALANAEARGVELAAGAYTRPLLSST